MGVTLYVCTAVLTIGLCVCVGAGAYQCQRCNSAYEILVGAMTKENCNLADKTTKYVHAPRAWFNYQDWKSLLILKYLFAFPEA